MESLDLFGEPSEHKAGNKRRKSNSAYRTISEVAKHLGVATHVLRFWETKFPQIKPVKQAGGRRYYRPEDIQVLEKIQHLLHEEGYTIRGVQALFKSKNIPDNSSKKVNQPMDELLAELKDIRKLMGS